MFSIFFQSWIWRKNCAEIKPEDRQHHVWLGSRKDQNANCQWWAGSNLQPICHPLMQTFENSFFVTHSIISIKIDCMIDNTCSLPGKCFACSFLGFQDWSGSSYNHPNVSWFLGFWQELHWWSGCNVPSRECSANRMHNANKGLHWP